MRHTSFCQHADGIAWHCEMRGSGPVVVLIPSGEGDCGNFERTADSLADRFTVLTFDTPGFSRSGAPADIDQCSLPNLAGQIAVLLQSLDLARVTVYGCSSGGRAALDLVAGYPELVLNAIVHEAALPNPEVDGMLLTLAALSDAEIIGACQHIFATLMNEDEALWTALGEDYHARLKANYVTWVRRYIAPGLGAPIDPATLRGRPITWTIGALTERAMFQSNFDTAAAAGIAIGTLPCCHFPQVSIPETLALHITEATLPHLD